MNNLQHNEPLVPIDQTVEGGLAATLTCWCGAPLPVHSGRGRQRLFCCPAHKQAEYRNRLEEKRNTKNILVCNHALPVLQTLDANSIDCLVTDPPYGYSFMGKDWDRAVPSVEIWKECVRVLKPGAFAFIMSAPRQDVLSQMIVRLSEAGFRTDFTSLYWAYASGFPKASNIGKMVDKRLGTYVEGKTTANARFSSVGDDGHYNHAKITREFTPQSEQAKTLDGSYGGFQPKPAVEVILVCMKPLSEKTFVDQALNNGKGITWLDDCRIPYEQIPTVKIRKAGSEFGQNSNWNNHENIDTVYDGSKGRFPANLLVSDDALNNGHITKSTGGKSGHTAAYGGGYTEEYYQGKNPGLGDTGSYSRYFDLDKWFEKKLEELPDSVRKTFPYLLVPKASKSEKNRGCEDLPLQVGGGMQGTQNKSLKTGNGNERNNLMQNSHPTVKPLKLMSYLIILGSRQGDVILDPFMGSGTTCLAAFQLGRRFIGIDLNNEYVNIAQNRLDQAS